MSRKAALAKAGRAVLIRALLLFGSTAVALVLFEGVIRVVTPQQLIVSRAGMWTPADSVGWRHSPELNTPVNTGERTVTLRTDAEGFRVGVAGRIVGEDSVLVIGDSFMAALQVEYEQSLPGLLEDSLRTAEGGRVAVRNAGVGGWDAPHYVIFGGSRLSRFRYGAVLVSVFNGNDLVREMRRQYDPVQQDQPSRLRVPRSLSAGELIDAIARPVNDGLETRSHLFVFFKSRLEPLRIRLGLSVAEVPDALRKDRADGPEWAVTADALTELAEVATSHGSPVLFVVVPSHYQVDEQLFRAHAQAFGLDTLDLDLDQPSRRLTSEMRARGLLVVDVLDDFRDAHADGSRLYGQIDTHLTPAGHARLFELTAPLLDSLLSADRPGEIGL